MKTAVIFKEIPEPDLKYFVLDGDYTHLEGTMIGGSCEIYPQDKQDELLALMYDNEGEDIQKERTLKEFKQAIVDGAEVIECGFFL